MAHVTIERLSVEQARRRMAEILAQLRMTPVEMERKASRYQLNAQQRALAAEYEGLEYLLDERS